VLLKLGFSAGVVLIVAFGMEYIFVVADVSPTRPPELLFGKSVIVDGELL
jgi:hypothetical protein